MVATVRALKMHGGVGKIVAGKPLDPALLEENVEAVRTGAPEPRGADRDRHDVRHPGGRRHQLVPDRHAGRGRGDPRGRPRGRRADAVVATHFVDGGDGRGRPGRGGLGGEPRTRRADVPAALPGRGAARREDRDDRHRRSTAPTASSSCPAAQKSLKQYEDLGLRPPAGLHGQDPVLAQPRRQRSRAARPGFTVPIREVRLSAGAGFITPLCGEMRTMPGLPSVPGGENIDIDAEGNVVGLF